MHTKERGIPLVVYLYDGSFDGLLTCVYHNYHDTPAEGIYPLDTFQPAMMVLSTAVSTDYALSAKVYRAIQEKIAEESLEMVYRVFLSSNPDKEMIILDYLRLGFKMGSLVDSYHSHPQVYPLHKVARQVSREVHRFLGLLRFKDLGGVLFAALDPDHNIISLLADHFADRLAGERWIIYDTARKTAVVYNGRDLVDSRNGVKRKWYMTDFACDSDITGGTEENLYQEMWKSYFEQIGIKSRYNPKLQSQFVPLRYRRHLLEFHNIRWD